jgi:TonB family protein
MTFRQSLYISFFAHLVALGGAIAFAQLTGALILRHPEVVSVSLVSLGTANASERDIGRHQNIPNHPVQKTFNDRPAEEQQIQKTFNDRPAEEQQIQKTLNDRPAEEQQIQKTLNDRPAEEQLRTIISGLHPNADTSNNSNRSAVKDGNDGGSVVRTTMTIETARNGSDSIGVIVPEQWAAIESAIRRHKNYPRLARERGIEGVVRLRFTLNPTGAVDKIEILQSSGSEVLDNASVQAVYRATPMPYIKGWVEIPIAYVLK